MLRRFLILPIISLLLAGCAADDDANSNAEEGYGPVVDARFTIGAVDTGSRATSIFLDPEASLREGFADYKVFLFNASGTLVATITNSGLDAGTLRDEISETIAAGTYTAYSFGNIGHFSAVIPGFDENTVTAAQLEAATFPTAALGFSTATALIPMSNKESITINDDGTVSNNLHLFRMYAKMEIQVINQTGDALTLNYLDLSDITVNNERIPLLPTHNPIVSDHAACFVDFSGIAPAPATESVHLVPEVEMADKDQQVLTFYVNESALPQNLFNRFAITVGMTVDGTNVEQRYTLLSDHEDWSYIARNDYRIIPLRLMNYKLELIPIDFPPIGVYPASVMNEDGIFTCTFHAGGHFHLVPRVTTTDGSEESFYGVVSVTCTGAYYADGTACQETDLFEPFDAEHDSFDSTENGSTLRWDNTAKAFIGCWKEGVYGYARYKIVADLSNLAQVTYNVVVIHPN